MELIPGLDLRHWLGDRHNQPITNEQAIDWLQQIIEILAKIHQHHCFHRDIKPSNIMLRPNGQLALIDFGAVREVTETYLQKCEEDITRTHVYSRGYTPIEQMQGRAVPESDFFALGRTFVHLMTGSNPLEFSVDAHTGRLNWRADAPQISTALADLIDCLMAPFPGQRPHHPSDIQAALAEIQANPSMDGAVEGTVLSTLMQPQRAIDIQPGLEGINVLGTLPITDAASAFELTQPPLDEMVDIPSDGVNQGRSMSSRWRRVVLRLAGLPLIMMCSVLATGSITGLRFAGILQNLELQALDTILHLRPSEPLDERLLLITVDEEDLLFQSNAGMVRQGSLADEALFQVLETITPHQPRVIGLDIYRETTVGSLSNGAQTDDLTSDLASQAYLQGYSNLVVVCSVGGGTSEYSAIAPPATVPLERVGFSDIPLDGDGRVRRHIVGMDGAEHCDTSQSLSYQLAARYLAASGLEPSMNEQQVLSFGDRPFPPLKNHTGGYHRGNLGGYELLLNYRQTDTVVQIVTLREVLDGSLSDELATLVGDRAVLIGTVAPSFGDYHPTPSGDMAGVVIQAHMVSQLLSAALDDRPVLWAWAPWSDALWVLGWTMVGGAAAWVWRSRWVAWGSAGVVMLISVGAAYLMVLIGGWMPLVPTVLAMMGAIASLRALKGQAER